MTNSALQLLSTLMHAVWTLTTCFKIPGTNVTPLAFILFIPFTALSIRFIKSLFGALGDSNDSFSGSTKAGLEGKKYRGRAYK